MDRNLIIYLEEIDHYLILKEGIRNAAYTFFLLQHYRTGFAYRKGILFPLPFQKTEGVISP